MFRVLFWWPLFTLNLDVCQYQNIEWLVSALLSNIKMLIQMHQNLSDQPANYLLQKRIVQYIYTAYMGESDIHISGKSRSHPDSKVHGTNMGPIWGRHDPGGPVLASWTLLSGQSYSRNNLTYSFNSSFYITELYVKDILFVSKMQRHNLKAHLHCRFTQAWP